MSLTVRVLGLNAALYIYVTGEYFTQCTVVALVLVIATDNNTFPMLCSSLRSYSPNKFSTHTTAIAMKKFPAKLTPSIW